MQVRADKLNWLWLDSGGPVAVLFDHWFSLSARPQGPKGNWVSNSDRCNQSLPFSRKMFPQELHQHFFLESQVFLCMGSCCRCDAWISVWGFHWHEVYTEHVSQAINEGWLDPLREEMLILIKVDKSLFGKRDVVPQRATMWQHRRKKMLRQNCS